MRALLTLALACLLSMNASAGLIELSTDWRAGVVSREGMDDDYSQDFGGRLSFIYEEGSNLISSMTFFDEHDTALYSLVGSLQVEWPHAVGGNAMRTAAAGSGGHYIGHEVDGSGPLQFVDLVSGEFLRMGITEMTAHTASTDIAPTLDNFGGLMFGGLFNESWGMSFFSGDNTVRKAVAAVPEPSSLAILCIGLGLVALGMLRRNNLINS